MDVVVTVPKDIWGQWLAEGDLPGTPWSGRFSYFKVAHLPRIEVGERVYIVAHGRLRGYAPLVSLGDRALVRGGQAEAVTIPQFIPGFRGYRYRWWDRDDEMPFPDFALP